VKQNPALQLRNVGGSKIVSNDMYEELCGCVCAAKRRMRVPMQRKDTLRELVVL